MHANEGAEFWCRQTALTENIILFLNINIKKRNQNLKPHSPSPKNIFCVVFQHNRNDQVKDLTWRYWHNQDQLYSDSFVFGFGNAI